MKKTLYIALLSMSIISCKTTKTVAPQPVPTEIDSYKKEETTKVPNATLNKLATTHNNINRAFQTAQIISTVNYKDQNFDQSVKADIRIEQGKQILITVKALMLNVAKIYITPERVSYYEIIKGTHYDGDFSLINKMLGTPLSYNQVENIFLGKSIYSLTDNTLELSSQKNTYQVDKNIQDFIISMIFNEKAELKTEKITSKNKTYAELNYIDYQNIAEVIFPKKWNFQTQQIHKMNIQLQYDKVELNTKISFKYEIPNGSKPIKN